MFQPHVPTVNWQINRSSGRRKNCQRNDLWDWSQSTSQSNQLITEIYCEKSSLKEGSVCSTRSSEIKWMFAISVCFDNPEFRAWWTAWIKLSRGVEDGKLVGPTKEGLCPVEVEGVKVVEVGPTEVVEKDKGIWIGRSVRSRGFPKASSPLSRIARKISSKSASE